MYPDHALFAVLLDLPALCDAHNFGQYSNEVMEVNLQNMNVIYRCFIYRNNPYIPAVTFSPECSCPLVRLSWFTNKITTTLQHFTCATKKWYDRREASCISHVARLKTMRQKTLASAKTCNVRCSQAQPAWIVEVIGKICNCEDACFQHPKTGTNPACCLEMRVSTTPICNCFEIRDSQRY